MFNLLILLLISWSMYTFIDLQTSQATLFRPDHFRTVQALLELEPIYEL